MPLVFLLALLAAPDAGSTAPFVRMRWHDTSLMLTWEGRSLHYDVAEIGLYDIDKAKTVSLLEKAGVVYLLVHVEGPSRGPKGAMHQCGAGTEAGLALLAFDRHGQVKKPEFVVTESCWQDIYGDDDVTFKTALDTHLVGAISYIDHQRLGDAGAGDQRVMVHIAFDPEHPELGLQFAQQCKLEGSDTPVPCAK
jgi:hypothetical protein